jgi:hypothetical protein
MIQAARSELCPNNLNIALASHFPAYERPNIQMHPVQSFSFQSFLLLPKRPDMQRLTLHVSLPKFFTLPHRSVSEQISQIAS